MENNSKPIVLTFIGNYLPGFKSGGILRSMVNTVDNLSNDVSFWIVTLDRDLGDYKPYENIRIHKWQSVGNAMVYYLTPKSITLKNIRNLILETKHDILYLNSFFDSFTIKVLFLRRLSRSPSKAVIVAPRGEFAWASLKLKYLKKIIFIKVARLIDLYNNVTWHASSTFEGMDIIKVMKIDSNKIQYALDMPARIIREDKSCQNTHSNDIINLRIVFLSRISREKNLDYSLRILSKVRAKVIFDIYGPSEDLKYYKECQDLICQLPSNVIVNYLGSVNPNQVVEILSRYDLLLFPSGGENYGHVIAESLIAGTPVLISDQTPWRNLQESGFGWDISLEHIDSFIEIIEKYAVMNFEDRLRKRNLIKAGIRTRLLDPEVLEANRRLFLSHYL